MDRIAQAFARAGSRNRAAFVAYLCAGDPDFDASLAACRAVIKGGADILELGVPFSDPLADGLTNQLAAQRALEAGMKAAGVDGMLTLDLPPEEADDMLAAGRTHDLKTVFIVAPTTPPRRIPKITAAATGFVYYVSREGVTGVRDEIADGIPEALKRIRMHTSLPVVVGFGISRRDQVNRVARFADGVVVGSALVNCIKENPGDIARITTRLQAVASDLAAGTAR